MSLDIGGTGPVTAMGPDFLQYASGSVPEGSQSVARMYAATSSGGSSVVTLYFKKSDGTEIDLANAGSLNIAGDSGSGTTNLQSETLTFTGGAGVDTSVSGDTVTFVVDLNELSALGAAPAAADQLALVDATDNSSKKVTITNLADLMAGTVTSTGLSDSSGVLSLDIQNMTAATTVDDADLVVIDDGAGGTLRKMTRANFIESAALDSINIDGGAIDGTPIGANSAAAGTFTTLTANTAVVPDSSGGADLGSTSAEWGDLFIADDKAAKFGSDQDALVQWSTGGEYLEISGSGNGMYMSGNVVPGGDSLYDLGTSALQWKDVHADAGYIDAITVTGTSTLTTVDINGGAIDGVAIGASTAGAGSFTTLAASGDVDLGDATSDTITATGRFDSDLVPATDSARDLGTSALQWAELHVDAGHIDQLGSALDANSQAITNINVDSGAIDGVTIGTNSAATRGVFTTLTASYFEVTNDLTVSGNLNVVGNINSIEKTVTTLEIVDKLILAASGANSSDSDTGGLQIGGYNGTDNVASVLYDHSNAALDFNIGGTTEIRLEDGKLLPQTDSDVDLGSSTLQFKDVHADAGYIDAITVTGTSTLTTVDINGGAIDGTVIGAASAVAGTFTDVSAQTVTASAGALIADNIRLEFGSDKDASITYDEATTDSLIISASSGGTAYLVGDFVPSHDSLFDLGSSSNQWADVHADAGYIDAITVTGTSTLTTVDINGGAIDGATIGANSAAAATFTSLDCTDGAFAVANLDIDGATDIGAALADADLIMVDDGAGGTNVKSAMSRVKTYIGTGLTMSANLDLGENNIVNVGVIEADTIQSDADASGLKVNFDGNTGTNEINLTDNLADALSIAEGSNDYMKFTTTDSQEGVGFGKMAAPLTDNAVSLGAGSYRWAQGHIVVAHLDQLGQALDANSQAITNINVDSGAIDGTPVGANSASTGAFTTLSATGDVDLGDATSDTITATARFDSALVPSTDSARDLGTVALQWANVYADKIGCHTAGALTVSGSAGVAVNGGANSDGYALELANSADTGKARAYAWVTYSSARLKKNIETLEKPMDKIMKMRGVSYEWKSGGNTDVGFIAEEMGQVLPEVVHFGKDGRAQSIDYSRVTSVLVEAVKELKAELDELKNSK